MNYSITTKISIAFLIVFSIICTLFVTFGKLQKDILIEKTKDSQLNSIGYLIGSFEAGYIPQNLNAFFANFKMKVVENEKLIKQILKDNEKIFTRSTPFGKFTSLKHKDCIYLLLENQSFLLLFENKNLKGVNDILWIGFFLASILLVVLYISVIKSLSPLKKLNKNIKKFANGNLDIKCFDGKYFDEISEVAFEFDNAVTQIRKLINSRQLFLRTIMHELKTPIGKGRIVSEMIEDDTQKKRLIRIFERLDFMINEFAKIEQLLSKSYSLNYQDCHFSLVLEQTRDILMLDDFEKKVQICMENDAIIKVDFQLFSLAIKNLIDNALKYSTDKKCKIICDLDKICVINSGEKEIDISHFKEAFIRKSNSKVSGLGLGLYIIDKICSMHKFNFDYEFKDNSHHFYIKFDKPAIRK